MNGPSSVPSPVAPAKSQRTTESPFTASDGKVYRNGYELHPTVALRLLALWEADARNTADWFHPFAAQHARALEAALRQAGIIPRKAA
jgi:hypothetical protein